MSALANGPAQRCSAGTGPNGKSHFKRLSNSTPAAMPEVLPERPKIRTDCVNGFLSHRCRLAPCLDHRPRLVGEIKEQYLFRNAEVAHIVFNELDEEPGLFDYPTIGWFDIKTGRGGVGATTLLAHIHGIPEGEAEYRCAQFVSITFEIAFEEFIDDDEDAEAL